MARLEVKIEVQWVPNRGLFMIYVGGKEAGWRDVEWCAEHFDEGDVPRDWDYVKGNPDKKFLVQTMSVIPDFAGYFQEAVAEPAQPRFKEITSTRYEANGVVLRDDNRYAYYSVRKVYVLISRVCDTQGRRYAWMEIDQVPYGTNAWFEFHKRTERQEMDYATIKHAIDRVLCEGGKVYEFDNFSEFAEWIVSVSPSKEGDE